jgi:hypothetical protein
MANGTDEDGARTARMDEWWCGKQRRGSPRGAKLSTSFFSLFPYLFCKGDSYPGTCAQRTAEGGGSPLLELTGPGLGAGFLCSFLL